MILQRLAVALGGLSLIASFMLVLPGAPTRFNKYEVAQRSTVLIAHSEAQGSGVAIRRVNAQGKVRWFVWTAGHVVAGQTTADVVVVHRHEAHKAGRTVYKSRVLARNALGDYALLQVDAPPDAFAPSVFATELPHVGDPIFIIGNMLGEDFDNAVSLGNIAQLGVLPETSPPWPWPVTDQTTAPVYPGNSGGPVFNANSEVLGLCVGSMNATLNVYVPIRNIEDWACGKGVLWATRGKWCPDDRELTRRAASMVPIPSTSYIVVPEAEKPAVGPCRRLGPLD